MLTRLKVSGFKNLVDVDIRFGPFTCIAGANGVGKSNLFDAIRFLSALADLTLMDAALSVRAEGERTGDVRSLFHRVGAQYDNQMSFEAEMIVPPFGKDDLGQDANASITFLRYSLVLGYRGGADGGYTNGGFQAGELEILKEELAHITQGEARRNLPFYHKPVWRKAAVIGERRTPYFISTDVDERANRVIRQHQDGGSSGRPFTRLAGTLPRTVLSVANAAETPTALMARREMQSWRLLQLEPTALRRPDPFSAPSRLGADGSHLPSTLYRLAHTGSDSERVYAQIANRLAELVEDVDSIRVDRDDKRELFTLYVANRDGTTHPARALSDGTLRFMALAVLEQDPSEQGLVCLEEPENGIHPGRIPAMLHLLQDIATDTENPVDSTNPLRQVIVNTHSPSVVREVPEDSLIVAELLNTIRQGQRFKRAAFSYLPDTWRDRTQPGTISNRTSLGNLLAYLIPLKHDAPTTRVADRFEQMILFSSEEE